jgi:hypothetical protein
MTFTSPDLLYQELLIGSAASYTDFLTLPLSIYVAFFLEKFYQTKTRSNVNS